MPQVLQSARLGESNISPVKMAWKTEIVRQSKDLQLISKLHSSLARALQLNSLAVVAGVGPQLQTSANPKTL